MSTLSLKEQTANITREAQQIHDVAVSIKDGSFAKPDLSPIFLDPAFAEQVIRNAGGHIYCVEFVKRGDGSLRRMVCRSGVFPPEGADVEKRMVQDARHCCLTVWEMAGGGAWKRISLDSIVSVTAEGKRWVSEPCWKCGKPTASDESIDPLYCPACARAAQNAAVREFLDTVEAIRDGKAAFCGLDEHERFTVLQGIVNNATDAACVLAHRIGYDEPSPAERRQIEMDMEQFEQA